MFPPWEGLEQGLERCQGSHMKPGHKTDSELLFSVLPATLVILLTSFADLLILLGEKSLRSFPK